VSDEGQEEQKQDHEALVLQLQKDYEFESNFEEMPLKSFDL
jgi:hypothetical protein